MRHASTIGTYSNEVAGLLLPGQSEAGYLQESQSRVVRRSLPFPRGVGRLCSMLDVSMSLIYIEVSGLDVGVNVLRKPRS